MNLQNAFCQNGDVLEKIKEIDPLHNKLYQRTDEITMGRMFSDTFQDVMKFNVTAKAWYVYDGSIWTEDTGSVVTGRLAEVFARCLQIHLAQSVSANANSFETDYQKYALRLGNRNARLKMTEDAKHHSHIKTLDFDKNTDLLNVKNGTLNLNTFELSEHKSEDLLTKICNASFNPESDSYEWEKFMDEVFEGDQEKIDYLQMIFGYGLTADTSKEDCYMLYGSTTRNGKSTLLRTMETMLGSYAMSINPESLAARKLDGRQASGDLARLKGCRFLHCSEPQRGMILDAALLKKMTGRDSLTVRNLYEREFEFFPEFKLFFNTNHRPVINDMTLFSSGRIKVIECSRHFSEEEQDVHLKEKLETEENLSGILNWCLEGLKRFREDELHIPSCVIQATNAYKAESDKIQLFIDECVQSTGSDFNLLLRRAYDAYKGWCAANGYRAEGKKNFKEMLSSKIPISHTGTVNGQTYYNVLLCHTLTQDGADYASKFERNYD